MKIFFFVSIYCLISTSFANWILGDTDWWRQTGGLKFIRVVPSNESESLDIDANLNETEAVDNDEEFNEPITLDLNTVNGNNETDAVDNDEEFNEPNTLDHDTVNGQNETDVVDNDEEFNEPDTLDLHTLNGHNESDAVDIGEEFNSDDLLDLLTEKGHNSCPCASAINSRRFLNRIVGGYAVPDDISFPYQAFFYAGGYACGATILNRRYVLTAMHCLSGVDGEEHEANSSLVFIGSIHLSRSAGGDVLGVTRFIKHPDFNNRTLENDIAIIEVDEDIKFNNSVAAACLPTSWEDEYVGRDAVVTGWGATIGYEEEQPENQNYPNSLKQTEVTVLNASEPNCARDTLGHAVSKMCAYKNGTDACQGDSGGPLTVVEGGVYVVIGVVSYGFGCAAEDRPGIYARVNNYLRWIVDNTEDGRC